MTPIGRRRLLLGGAGLLAGAAGLGIHRLLSPAAQASLAQRRFTDLEGNSRRLDDWSGKIRLVNFWGSWCAPCREEVPALIQSQSRYEKNGFQVVGIAIDSDAKVREFARTFGINYPVLLAGWEGVELIKRLGNSSGVLPYTLLLDRLGRRQWAHVGALTALELQQKIAAQL